jgi:hypothetical protein
MRRREFIGVLAGATASVCYRGAPAQGSTPARVGFISGLDQAAAADFLAAVRDGLAARGYVEPRTFKMELLFADYVSSRIPKLVENLERQHYGTLRQQPEPGPGGALHVP